ncbi:MAG: M23 family metallopeptidase [Acidobacteria bacterium]|nr:M23 family metallopeptidase [Acidobacteriota bacterium]
MKAFLLLLLVLVVVGAPAALYLLSAHPTLELTPVPRAIGAEFLLVVRTNAPFGLRHLSATVRQGPAVSSASYSEPANRFLFWKKRLGPATHALNLTISPARGFRSGPAKLSLDAVSNDLRAAATSLSLDVVLNLEPPRLTVDPGQHYITQGGAGLVTFTVAGFSTESGVKIGPYTFRSFPMPGAKSAGERFCLFVFPWDVPATARPVVYAANPAGQQVTATFHASVKPGRFRKRDLELTGEFLDKAIAALDLAGTGDPLDRFLRINGELRRQNNSTLAALRDQTEQRFLWTPPFQQLSNSKVEAFFADVRSYKYQGKKVDQQVHLGFDLSKVQQAPVVASAAGKVLHASALGIYGNCIVIDHGYGLQSIYGHLSSIAVKPGQAVQRGEEIGRSGATGLAGGDHLHFSIQIDGVQANPLEWWDPHWINDRILSQLPASAISGGQR